jgi:hypothetical protein
MEVFIIEKESGREITGPLSAEELRAKWRELTGEELPKDRGIVHARYSFLFRTTDAERESSRRLRAEAKAASQVPSAPADAGPFEKLFLGESEAVYCSVSIPGTLANQDKPDGVYELTRSEFVAICVVIAEKWATRDRENYVPLEVAKACDDVGLVNRWFRLSPEVAAWLNSKEPTLVVTAHVG